MTTEESRNQRISEISDGFLERLRNGQSQDFADLLAANGDLEPQLSRRLQTILLIWRSGQSRVHAESTPPAAVEPTTRRVKPPPSAGDDLGTQAETPLPGRVRRIHCPHCGIGLHLVDDPPGEITCRACGSSIPVDPARTRTQSIPPLARQTIGHFTLLAVLGQGSFGTVYKARDEQLQRVVAVKIPRDGFFQNAEERQRFVREAQHAGRLSHPQIVTVHGIYEDSGIPLIVSEWIDGITLADLASSRQLEFRETADLLAQICDAVQHAHSKGIIHRDLKPSNILLDRDRRPHVADFGLARFIGGDMTMTMDGKILGTLLYMPPEQAAGSSSKLRNVCDIYSLGVILYRLLSGSLPFRGSERMVLHQIQYEEPKPLRSLNESIPRDLETITARAMAKEQQERYQTAAELAAELRRWLHGDPIHARPVSRLERTVRWCRRRPLLAGLLASIAMLLMAVLALTTVWAVSNSQLAGKTLESRNRLVRVLENEGQDYLEANDLLRSLPWFTQALQVDEKQPSRHRLRLGQILNQCPTLNQLWAVDNAVTSIQPSHSGQHVAVGDASGTIALFDPETGTRRLLQGHSTALRGLQFSPDDQFLISWSLDNDARLWDVSRGLNLARFQHAGVIRNASFTSTGERVLTAAFNGTVSLWQTADGVKLRDFNVQNRYLETAVISQDGQSIAASVFQISGDNLQHGLIIWDARSGDLRQEVALQQGVESLIFAHSGQELLIHKRDGQLDFLDPQTAEPVRPALIPGGKLVHVSYSSDDRQVLTISDQGQVAFWTLGDTATALVNHRLAERRLAGLPAFARSGQVTDIGNRWVGPIAFRRGGIAAGSGPAE